jgi:predicted nucleic acid-binding protein
MPGFLVDTNVLLRTLEPGLPEHAQATHAIASVKQHGHSLSVTPQVVVEFWCAATRPVNVNGLGLGVSQVAPQVEAILRQFPLLPDSPDVFPNWQAIVTSHHVKGKQVHDARLVAVMRAHGVTNLLTFNTDDFKAYTEIKAVHPSSVA